MIIDAHQHVWDPSRARYDWLDDSLAPINRRIGFEELVPSLHRAGIESTVLIESADNDEDTELMLETADRYTEVAGIVAFVPLDNPARAAERLAELRFRTPLIVGVRNLIHMMKDPDWIIRPEVDEGLSILEDAGMTFDLVSVLPRHLEHVPGIVERHPGLKIVIDHLSKPPIGMATRSPWWELIKAAAESPTVFAKVSGLYPPGSGCTPGTPGLVRPYFLRALDTFGAERLMFGGDWPISIVHGGYDQAWDDMGKLLAELNDSERAAILGGTAARFYNLNRPATFDAESTHPG